MLPSLLPQRDVIFLISGACLGFGALAVDEILRGSVERGKAEFEQEILKEQIDRLDKTTKGLLYPKLRKLHQAFSLGKFMFKVLNEPKVPPQACQVCKDLAIQLLIENEVNSVFAALNEKTFDEATRTKKQDEALSRALKLLSSSGEGLDEAYAAGYAFEHMQYDIRRKKMSTLGQRNLI